METEHSRGGWLRFTVFAILSGTVLFLLGLWCLDSTSVPSPPLALPLPQRLLLGLGFILLNPLTIVPLTLILTTSRFLALKLGWVYSAIASFVGLTFILVGAFWVPNPIILWPISILGEHTLSDLIGGLFAFHIVPSPGGSNNTSAGFEPLFRWQFEECGARFCILIMAWTLCLATILIIQKRVRTAKSRQPSVAA